MAQVHSCMIGGALAFYETHRKRLVDAIGVGVVKYIEDFVNAGLAAADAPVGWTVTLVETGGGESTITAPDAVGGALLLTTDAFENDGMTLQLENESFELTSGQSAVYFGIKLQVNDATQTDFLVGLGITDTTPLGGISDAAYFECLDGGTDISVVTEKNTTETQTDTVGTLVDATDIVLEFFFDGTSVEFFIDGVSVAKHTANIPDDEILTPTIHFLTGEAVANTMQIDWIRVIQIGR